MEKESERAKEWVQNPDTKCRHILHTWKLTSSTRQGCCTPWACCRNQNNSTNPQQEQLAPTRDWLPAP